MNTVKKTAMIAMFLFAIPSLIFGQKLGLDDVIREVCTKSDSVKSMKESVIKSEQIVREKWSEALPKLSGSIQAARQYNPLLNPMQPPPKSGSAYYSSAVTASQPIYTFGKIGTGIEVANQFYQSAKSNYKSNLQKLQLASFDAFRMSVLAEITLSVFEKSLLRKKELSEFLTRNFELGSGSKAQVLQTRYDVVNQRTEIITAKQNVITSKLMLASMMGRSFSDTFQLDTGVVLSSIESFPLPIESDAIKEALANRGDLQSLEHLKKATQGGAKIFKALNLPSIGAQGSFGTAGSEPGDLIDFDKQRNWTVGLGLQWPFFDGFANSARAAQYSSDARKLEYAQNSVTKLIEIEIKTNLSECFAADSNMIASNEGYAAAQEGYDLTNDNFKQGSGQFVEVQLADERLRQAEMGMVNARYRLMRSRAALMVAMGRDIVTMEAK